jgi:hypothetical protein
MHPSGEFVLYRTPSTRYAIEFLTFYAFRPLQAIKSYLDFPNYLDLLQDTVKQEMDYSRNKPILDHSYKNVKNILPLRK